MPDDLRARFEQAAQEVQSLSRRPDNNTLLQLYGLYKQATAGDVNGARPGAMDFAGRAKHDAWTKLKGTGSDAAMQSYIDLVSKLKQRV